VRKKSFRGDANREMGLQCLVISPYLVNKRERGGAEPNEGGGGKETAVDTEHWKISKTRLTEWRRVQREKNFFFHLHWVIVSK